MDLGFVTRLGVLLIRPGLLVSSAPPFGGQYAPVAVKAGLSVLLAITMAPIVSVPDTVGVGVLAVVAVREAAIGLALGMSIRVLLAGAEVAGQLTGFQLGLAYAATVDPQSGARNNLVSTLYNSVALLTFLGVDGHHALLRAVAQSYTVLPIGAGHVAADLGGMVASLLGTVFVFGAQVAAPVVIVLLVVEVAAGIIARVAPPLNMMVIGFPLRLLAGLIALAAAIEVVPSVTIHAVGRAMELAGRLAYGFR
jgi:flagellar biosynthesis protein FliR